MDSDVTRDFDDVRDFLFEFADMMLKEEGSFVPYGTGLTADRDFTGADYDIDEEYPENDTVLAHVHTALVAQAKAGGIRAAGICMDVVLKPPSVPEPTDAICIELEHVSGDAAEVYVPYRIDAAGVIEYGEPIVTPGDVKIFLPVSG